MSRYHLFVAGYVPFSGTQLYVLRGLDRTMTLTVSSEHSLAWMPSLLLLTVSQVVCFRTGYEVTNL